MEHTRIIRVTGKGQLKLRPDTTRITVSLTGVCPEYADALEHAAADAETVKDVLQPFGFLREDLRTLHFSVDPEYEGYDDHGVYKNRFAGYRFRHGLKVEFPSDNARLGRILYALAHSSVQPELQIDYTVRDTEAAKNLLLEKAVADAKAKAELLAKASGVKLLSVLSIHYALESVDFIARPMARSMLCKAESADASYAFDVEPDDIEVNDTVTVVWQIA